MNPPLDHLVVLLTVLLTFSGFLALVSKRWTLAFFLFVVAIAAFWGYYLGERLWNR
jgi:hypothetical protein